MARPEQGVGASFPKKHAQHLIGNWVIPVPGKKIRLWL